MIVTYSRPSLFWGTYFFCIVFAVTQLGFYEQDINLHVIFRCIFSCTAGVLIMSVILTIWSNR